MPVGRPPKPTKLKVLQGTFRPCRATREPEPEILKTVPKPPKSLRGPEHKRASGEWKRVAGELVELELLSNLDLVALECYCLAYERMLTAEDALNDGAGLTIVSPKGFEMQRPEIAIASQARREVKDFLTHFGMSPASRSRINLKKKDSADGDPMEDLLGQG